MALDFRGTGNSCRRVGAQPVQLEDRSVLDDKVVLLLPATFALMGEEMLRLKYPSERRPTEVYTNPAGSVNVALNHTSNPVRPADLAAVHGAVEATFKKLYPSARWYDSKLVQIGGKRFFKLDLRTPAIDTEVRNLIVGTSFEGRLLLVTFNTVRALETDWVPIDARILNSIRIGG